MTEKDLGTVPVRLLIRKMSLPAVVGVMAYNVYNAADTVFVSRGIGTDAAGGLAISFPLFLFLSAFTSTLGSGASSVISRALGREDYETCARAVGNSFGIFYICAILITISGLIFLDPLLYAMGVTDAILPYARTYTKIILLGAVTCTGFSNLIRAEGSSRYAMYIWVIPISLNLILDPILIFGLDLGIAGAAVGTVAAQCVSMGMSVFYFFVRKQRAYRIRARHFLPDLRVIGEIIGIGVPSFFQMCGYAVSVAAVQVILQQASWDCAIGTFGMVNKIQTFLIFGITGVQQGISPIIGYNYGQKNNERVRETIRYACQILTGYGACVCVLIFLAWNPLMRLFSSDREVIDLGGHMLRIMGMGMIFNGIWSVQSAFFQAVGKKGTAMFLSLCGNVICFLPVLLFFRLLLGTEGIWYAFPVSNVLSMIVSAVCVRRFQWQI